MTHFVSRSILPAAAYLLSHPHRVSCERALETEKSTNKHPQLFVHAAPSLCLFMKTPICVTTCEPSFPSPNLNSTSTKDEQTRQKNVTQEDATFTEDSNQYFHGLFPKRQLWTPRVEYPLWDENWDDRAPSRTDDGTRNNKIYQNGVTRHIILIRHGQYYQTPKEDKKRILTPLGRTQAELTGARIAEMMHGTTAKFGPCNVRVLRVSNLTRAKETADIIASHVGRDVVRADPDPDLNEGRPCHHIPGGRVYDSDIEETDIGQKRIEAAYLRYFYRADLHSHTKTGEEKKVEDNLEEKITELKKNDDHDCVKINVNENMKVKHKNDAQNDTCVLNPKHEFEIIVCHANVIRYFLCRALQQPPETWLRLCTFNCSLTYLTIRPSGTVSCRMLGDIGHLGYGRSTFSMHHGFNW